MEVAPKIIHYVWMGKLKKNRLIQKCMKSWKKYLSDYTLKEWNEDSFDISSVPYVKEAYASKKWAFVSDYIRLYAIYNFGGIYLDTDVEILKPLNEFLLLPAFSGFENEHYLQTAIMGGIKGNQWYKDLLDTYAERHFVNATGYPDTTTNVATITDFSVKKYGLQLNNQFQKLDNSVFVYPSEWFSPQALTAKLPLLTENTYIIHHFSGSWLKQSEKFKIRVYKRLGIKTVKKIKTLLGKAERS